MASTRKPRPGLLERAPIAEWAAAGLGLILTLCVLGYLVWDGVTARPGPPALSVSSAQPSRNASGYTVPITVRNDSDATAAAVEVRAVLHLPSRPVEERRASFAYVPGRGEVKGGVVFEQDPRLGLLRISIEGYEEP